MSEPIQVPDPAEVCPGPPEQPYPPSDTWAWSHRWTPVVLMGMPGELADAPPRGPARVLSVCPTCRQWRQEEYTRLQVAPTTGG